jgi:hypothetical protein
MERGMDVKVFISYLRDKNGSQSLSNMSDENVREKPSPIEGLFYKGPKQSRDASPLGYYCFGPDDVNVRSFMENLLYYPIGLSLIILKALDSFVNPLKWLILKLRRLSLKSPTPRFKVALLTTNKKRRQTLLLLAAILTAIWFVTGNSSVEPLVVAILLLLEIASLLMGFDTTSLRRKAVAV